MAQLYIDGAGMTNNQHNKKDNTSMNYFTKLSYWRPLVPNDESLGKKTNPSLKNPCNPYVEDN